MDFIGRAVVVGGVTNGVYLGILDKDESFIQYDTGTIGTEVNTNFVFDPPVEPVAPLPNTAIVHAQILNMYDEFVLIAVLRNGELWRRVWGKQSKPEHEWTLLPGPYDAP